jgi:flagellum-specific peptidoglycan hydrolase FlgJ
MNPRSTTRKYVDDHHGLAIKEMHKYGIPASIKLAQGILESNSGTSELSSLTNNHFGIKCKDYWTGYTYLHFDDDYDENGELRKSCFRAYRSVKQSYRDHSVFLSNTERYNPLFELSSHDYASWAYHLQQLGYATNKNYSNILIRIIEENKLDRFDDVDKLELNWNP